MEYPKELVHKYGAKAGLLLYVARELPEIPQMKMVVSEPSENIETLLEKADKASISWPRLFRSSAVAELADHDGELETVLIEDYEDYKRKIVNPDYEGPYLSRERFNLWLRREIERVQESGRDAGLPNKINVIVAEMVPSQYTGTLIKHPNQDEWYLTTIAPNKSLEKIESIEGLGDRRNPCISTFTYNPKQGIEEPPLFSRKFVELTDTIKQQLTTAFSWHDQIVNLSEMDPRWTCLFEFGLNPLYLLQIRYFLRRQKADFELEKKDSLCLLDQIVFGITHKDGINVRVETEENIRKRESFNRAVNPTKQPIAFFSKFNEAYHWRRTPCLKAALLFSSQGILEHNDVGLIRKVKVAAFYSCVRYPKLSQGDRVNIISDGTRVRIKKTGRK